MNSLILTLVSVSHLALRQFYFAALIVAVIFFLAAFLKGAVRWLRLGDLKRATSGRKQALVSLMGLSLCTIAYLVGLLF